MNLFCKYILVVACICGVGSDLGVYANDETEVDPAIKDIRVNIHIAEYFLSSKPDVAILYADTVELNSLRINFVEGLFKAKEIKARALKKKRSYEQAISYFDKAIDLAEEMDSGESSAMCYYEVGDIYMTLNNSQSAVASFDRALKYEEEIESPELLASLYAGLWTAYWEMGRYEESLVFQDKAVEVYRKNTGNKDVLKIVNQIGNTFRKTKKLDQALDYYQNALELNERTGKEKAVAKALFNIGDIYFLQKRYPAALTYFQKSIEMNDRPGGDKEGLMAAYMALAQVLTNMKNYQQAIDTTRIAIRLAEANRNLPYLVEGFSILSDIYERSGDEQNSLKYYKSYMRYKDSLINSEIAEKIANIASNYEFNQKEREIGILAREKEVLQKEANINELENRAKGYLIILLVVLIISISALSYIVWKRYEVKKKANDTIKMQYDEISFQKEQVEKQRDIIAKNNIELEKAQNIIQVQNVKLKDANERLEEKVNERTVELNRMLQKLSFHVENTPLAVMEWNDKLELTRWSRQAETMFGIAGNEMLGKTLDEVPIIHEDDKESVNELLEELLVKRKPRNFYKIRGVKKNGEIMYMEWSNSILFTAEGKPESILSIANDVSDREKAYYELQDLNQELDNFIYRASHDLQGPLSRMEGLIYLGKLESKDKISLGYFNMLGNVNNELNQILGRLRFVYNFYQRDLIVEEVKLHAAIDEVVEKIKSCRNVNGINFKNQVSPKLTWKGDKLLLDILLENLVENALCYRENGAGYVHFSAPKSNGAHCNLVVRDNGVGIPSDLSDRIFDVFFRGTMNPEEVGMNLYVAKKAVTRLGGNITLVNPAKDTIFEIMLPSI